MFSAEQASCESSSPSSRPGREFPEVLHALFTDGLGILPLFPFTLGTS